MPARLVLVATPLGNLGDFSPRARAALVSATRWFVEDTRVTGKLQSWLEVSRPMRVVNDHTSDAALKGYLDDLVRDDAEVVLVTDAGTPGISDPGARLVDLAYERGIDVDAIPGPSAVTDALALSGFFAQRYAFLGYPPRKSGPMRALLSPFATSPMTLVLFESPYRLPALVTAAHESLGERRIAICRELTKVHQQVARFRLPNLPSERELPRKGEVTVVIEGVRRGENLDLGHDEEG